MTTMDVELTDVWEYNVDKSFRLHGWATELIEFTRLGIPYRKSPDVAGKPTVRKVRVE